MTKPKRASLTSFASIAPEATEGTVQPVTQVQPARSTPALEKMTVYLTPDEVRTLKLICLDTRQRMTDIGATAIREWMDRNGHTRQHDA